MYCACAKNLCLGYNEKIIVKNLDLNIERGSIVTIIGPNGSGKSTVLKSFAKLLDPFSGSVVVENENLAKIRMKCLAKKVSILLQKNTCPADITVSDLLYYGRAPHKKWFEKNNYKDDAIILEAMKKTGIEEMKDCQVSKLSGGESQRVWLALALTQDPEILLLDEPTTYLDIGYQFELLDLILDINQMTKMTVIMVLHDLNQASRYSDKIYVLKNGEIYDEGCPIEIINKTMLIDVYNLEAKILYDEDGRPVVLPKNTRRNK